MNGSDWQQAQIKAAARVEEIESEWTVKNFPGPTKEQQARIYSAIADTAKEYGVPESTLRRAVLWEARPVKDIHQIYEEALEVSRWASRKFSAIQSDYRSGKISDDAFLKGKAAHDRAQEVFDAAEAAYIKAKAEARPIETMSHIEIIPTVAGSWVKLAGGGRSFTAASGMVIDGKPYSLKGESRLESSALAQAARLEGTIFTDVRIIYAEDSAVYYVYAASDGKPVPAEEKPAGLSVVDCDRQYSLSELKSMARAVGVSTSGDKKTLCRKLMDASVL